MFSPQPSVFFHALCRGLVLALFVQGGLSPAARDELLRHLEAP